MLTQSNKVLTSNFMLRIDEDKSSQRKDFATWNKSTHLNLLFINGLERTIY